MPMIMCRWRLHKLSAGCFHRMGVVEAHEGLAFPGPKHERVAQSMRACRRWLRAPRRELDDITLRRFEASAIQRQQQFKLRVFAAHLSYHHMIRRQARARNFLNSKIIAGLSDLAWAGCREPKP